MTDEDKNEILLNKRMIMARKALCKIFNIKAKFLRKNTNRKRDVIDARRFLVYYMYNELGIKYYHMDRYIIGMHHSTAIYQCNKLEDLFQVEKPLKKKYTKFISDSNNFDVLKTLIEIKKEEANHINREIYALTNNLKEKRNENNSTSS
tara:strand:- start:5478 stop:5924 length:447 start_codon:yes stop_codon:yes gene_type:complete